MPRPKPRDVPKIWFDGGEVKQAWEDCAALGDEWHTHTHFNHLRCVPLDVAEWLNHRAHRRIRRSGGYNCVGHSKGGDTEVFSWYVAKKLGYPACGRTIWHDWDGIPDDDRFTEPVRHAMAWVMNEDKEIWILDTAIDTIYPPDSLGGVYEHSYV